MYALLFVLVAVGSPPNATQTEMLRSVENAMLEQLQRAHELRPHDDRILRQIAEASLHYGDYRQASDAYVEALDIQDLSRLDVRDEGTDDVIPRVVRLLRMAKHHEKMEEIFNLVQHLKTLSEEGSQRAETSESAAILRKELRSLGLE